MLFDLDADRILSDSQQWLELSSKWGEPIDLEEQKETGHKPAGIPSLVENIQDLNRTTFDSCKFIRSLKRAREPSQSNQSIPTNYDDFANGIQEYKLIFQEDKEVCTSRIQHCSGDFFNTEKCQIALSSASSTVRHSSRQKKGNRNGLMPASSTGDPILHQGDNARECDCEITSVLCNEFSKVVERVSRDLVYLERHGKRRSSRRKISRSDVRHVKWNRPTGVAI